MKFNEKLVLLRKRHGYSQEALAEKLGVSRQAVSRWESGDTTPEMSLLIKICAAFNVSADYLIHDENTEESAAASMNKKDKESATTKKNHIPILFSAFCFIFAAVFAVIGVVFSTNSTQLGLSCFFGTLFIGLAIRQLIQCLKRDKI